jgi:hypothetical protein
MLKGSVVCLTDNVPPPSLKTAWGKNRNIIGYVLFGMGPVDLCVCWLVCSTAKMEVEFENELSKKRRRKKKKKNFLTFSERETWWNCDKGLAKF